MRHVVTNELRSFDILYLGGREADEGACLWEQGLEVDSPSLPKPHELNHAYAYLRKQREPIPFLAEGIAEAIACGTDVPATIDDVPWESVVAEPGTSNEIYTQGGALVRVRLQLPELLEHDAGRGLDRPPPRSGDDLGGRHEEPRKAPDAGDLHSPGGQRRNRLSRLGVQLFGRVVVRSGGDLQQLWLRSGDLPADLSGRDAGRPGHCRGFTSAAPSV